MKISIYWLFFLFIAFVTSPAIGGENEGTTPTPELSAKDKSSLITYVKQVFVARRQEQHTMVKDMLKSKYEKQYQLLSLGYKKTFELLTKANTTLIQLDFVAERDGFPTTNIELQGAVVLALDSCCMAAENLLHFPGISYRVFRAAKIKHWKRALNWCIHFVGSIPDIVDGNTKRLIALLQQEINEELRTSDYINPYADQLATETAKGKVAAVHPPKRHKPAKKVKKGPQLSGSPDHKEL